MSSIGYKIVMAATGLFLCLFLVVHLAGNLQIFLPEADARLQFNAYSKILSGNPLIRIASLLTTAAIVTHVILSLVLRGRNRRARETRYAVDEASATSPWYSRWMGVLGLVLLVFLVVHLRTFWVPYHFGQMTLDPAGRKDLYGVVEAAFANGWYAALYVLCMGALGFHLLHGVESSLRTAGLHHRRYLKWMRRLGILFSVGVSAGFAAIPIYVYVSQ